MGNVIDITHILRAREEAERVDYVDLLEQVNSSDMSLADKVLYSAVINKMRMIDSDSDEVS